MKILQNAFFMGRGTAMMAPPLQKSWMHHCTSIDSEFFFCCR